ncbi:MAG TPA: hypothetical protein VIC28_12665 [Thermoanaerobaculia bacterium]
MRPSHQHALDRWLAAELDARPEAADSALRELFEALPLIAPPAGFADRVLVRAGLPAARRDLFASRAVRLVLAACLVAGGLGALWLPPTLRALAGLWSLSGFVRAGVEGLISVTQWLASALRLGELLVTVGRTLTEPLTLPQVTAVLVICLLASSLGLRFLRDQITGERNWTYVDPV